MPVVTRVYPYSFKVTWFITFTVQPGLLQKNSSQHVWLWDVCLNNLYCFLSNSSHWYSGLFLGTYSYIETSGAGHKKINISVNGCHTLVVSPHTIGPICSWLKYEKESRAEVCLYTGFHLQSLLQNNGSDLVIWKHTKGNTGHVYVSIQGRWHTKQQFLKYFCSCR